MTDGGARERWQLLSRLFDELVDKDAKSRARRLLEVESQDPSLREQLERMLAHDNSDHLIDQGMAGIGVATDAAVPDAQWIAEAGQERLGSWQLQGLLGMGASGAVFRATRKDDSGQVAAIKRLRQRWDGSAQAQRFLQERRILAALSHPHIPQVLDHGLDSEARPWFALTLVQGLPITDWADTHKLSLAARVDLLLAACAAVQHAHTRFIVHRDLKPANILVDDEGHPMVLDFGVAKRLDMEEGSTRTGLLAGFTPEYAAPEQVSGGAVTAATDVYALGVILYQLMTGRLPYTTDSLNLRSMAEVISDVAPMRVEQAIATDGDVARDARLSARAIDLSQFRRFVRGDMARILQTALAKEPERRYASVEAFAADLKHLLQGRPVSVSGDTWRYRMGKYVRRNRWAVAMGGLAVIAFASGVTGVVLKSREVRQHAQLAQAAAVRAEQEAARAKASRDFLLEMLAEASPEESGEQNRDVTIRQFLDKAVPRIGERFSQAPALRAEMFAAVGGLYEEMGDFEKAVALATEALKALPADTPPLERAKLLLQRAYPSVSRGPEFAEKDLEQVRALQAAGLQLPDDVLLRLHNLESTMAFLTGKRERALEYVEKALPLERKLYGADSLEYAERIVETSYMRKAEDAVRDTPLALAYFQKASAGESTPGLMRALWAHGSALSMAGRGGEAIGFLQQAMPMAESLFGRDSPRHARSMQLLAVAEFEVGPLPQMIERARHARAIFYAESPDHPLVQFLDTLLARALLREGKLEEAETIARRILADEGKRADLRARLVAVAVNVQLQRGKPDVAETLLADALETGVPVGDSDAGLLRARIARWRGDLAASQRLLDPLAQDSWLICLERAEVAELRGDVQGRRKWAEQALQLLSAQGAKDVPELHRARALLEG